MFSDTSRGLVSHFSFCIVICFVLGVALMASNGGRERIESSLNLLLLGST